MSSRLQEGLALMKQNNGFICLQELLIFSLCITLLVSSAVVFIKALRILEVSGKLTETLQLAEQNLAGIEVADMSNRYKISRRFIDSNCLKLVEVQVTDGEFQCNLLQVQEK